MAIGPQMGYAGDHLSMSVWQGFGYNMLLFTAGIHAVPETYYDAARVDGASRWRIVPEHHHTAHIPFAVLRDRVDSYYLFSGLHAGLRADSRRAGYKQHDPGVLVVRKGVYDYAMGYASAIAWVLFLIVIVLTIVQLRLQRRWVHYEA